MTSEHSPKGVWGNNSHFWPKGQTDKVVGWSPRTPRKGDMYKYRGADGAIVTRKIVEVTRPGNPPDMWFATLGDDKPWWRFWR